MHFQQILLLLAPLATVTSAIKCYGDGPKWNGNVATDHAKYVIGNFCRSLPPLNSKDIRSTCATLNGGNNIKIGVQYNNGGTVSLRPDDCIKDMESILKGCERGGDWNINGFYYRVDSNHGSWC